MKRRLCLLAILLVPFFAHAQEAPVKKKKANHSFYLSWGYNKEWYTKSNVHVRQNSLGNDYTLHKVIGHDHPGWDETSIFKQALTIPQYNYRIGYMFNERKGLGIEINFDHTKYIIQQDQDIRLSGKLNNQSVDTSIRFSNGNGHYYFLNNGANFFLINLVKRMKLYESRNEWLRVDGLGKAGIGPVVPHVENSFFGKANKPHFQVGGWNVGLEADIKVTFYKYIFLEYGAKLDYARYSGLRIYEGKARQAFGTFEMILSLGVNVPPIRKSKS